MHNVPKGMIYTQGLLTKREVNMAGHWPHSCFVSVWTLTLPLYVNMQKLDEANIQPPWLNKFGQEKILFYGLLENVSCRTPWAVPSRQQQHLAHLGNQSQYRIWFILPTHRTSHLINPLYQDLWYVSYVCVCVTVSFDLDYWRGGLWGLSDCDLNRKFLGEECCILLVIVCFSWTKWINLSNQIQCQ